MDLSGQGAVSLYDVLRCAFSGLRAVEQQVGKPLPTLSGETVYLKIFFPEFIKTPKVCFFAEFLEIGVPGEQIIVVIGIFFLFFPKSLTFFRCGKYTGVGKIHKGGRNPKSFCCPQGHQFRGIIQKRIVAFVMFFFFRKLSRFIVVGVVDSERRFRVRICHNGNQLVCVFRPLDQNNGRGVFFHDFFHMERTGGTVMSHRKQHYFSHFLAS